MKNLKQAAFLSFFLAAGSLSGVARAETSAPRILAMGDSLLAWHKATGRSISATVSRSLKQPVIDRSVGGARFLYRLPISGALGMNITKQYRGKPWDWVILNGGGNDMWLGCGCNRCDRKLNRLISESGRRGAIPQLVSRLRKTGARVVYVGYLRSPGVGSPIEHCRDEGDALESRISHMATLDTGIYFLSLADLVPYGDRSFHGVDMIHPSLKASTEIGHMVARLIHDNSR
jgi:hypothetical protein